MASAPKRQKAPGGGRRRQAKAKAPPETPAPANIFDNPRYFPSFDDLPSEGAFDERYHAVTVDRPLVTYTHTWCFLGQITQDDTAQVSFLRNAVWVRDRAGRNDIFVAFYPEEGTFDFQTLKRGHTLCVLFAEQHIFLDTKIGLRIEDLDTVKVIPSELDQVIALGKQYFENRNECWGCGLLSPSSMPPKSEDPNGGTQDEGGPPPVKLLKCSQCSTALYCNKECQHSDWKARHRLWCKAIPVFLKVASIDYPTYSRDSHF